MPTENPWLGLTAGAAESRRVDAGARWNWFWAVMPRNDLALVLQLSKLPDPLPEPPNLRNLEIKFESLVGGPILYLRLKDGSQVEIFETLCRDVIVAGEMADTELQVVERAIRRTFRWHNLLRGGNSGALTEDEQKGLIGEIEILKLLIAEIGPKRALSAWMGPSGAPKDFELPYDCIETKARRAAAQPFVKISNEHQLADVPGRRVWLAILAVDKIHDPLGKTLSEIVGETTAMIERHDPSALIEWEMHLADAGYDFQHDYSSCRWIASEPSFHLVSTNFPRIAAPVALGVSDVSYSLALSACSPFQTEMQSVKTIIFGRNGNE